MTQAMPYRLHVDPAADRVEWVPLGVPPTCCPAAGNRPGSPSDPPVVIGGSSVALGAPDEDADSFVWT